jgi:elongator complex protein 1
MDVVGSVDDGISAVGWSPDEELLVLTTPNGKLIEMTRDFDVLAEIAIDIDEFGEQKPVNVGWGRKETQFHGTAGKTAALQSNSGNAGLSPNDDSSVSISWRGDGNFFAVSAIVDSKRVIRVFDRQAILQSTSEPVDKLEHTLCWRPSGNLISSSLQLPHRHDIVFFERNGLRHGEFSLEAGIIVHKLLWNVSSTVLAALITDALGRSCSISHLFHLL